MSFIRHPDAYTDDIMQPAYRKGASAYTSSDREVYNALKTTGLTVTNKLLPKPAAGPDDKTEPTSDQPAKTGDTTDITLAAALVMISLAGGVTVILMRRNRKKTK